MILYHLKETNEPNLRKWQKNYFDLILAYFGQTLVPKNFFVGFTSTRC